MTTLTVVGRGAVTGPGEMEEGPNPSDSKSANTAATGPCPDAAVVDE